MYGCIEVYINVGVLRTVSSTLRTLGAENALGHRNSTYLCQRCPSLFYANVAPRCHVLGSTPYYNASSVLFNPLDIEPVIYMLNSIQSSKLSHVVDHGLD